MSSQGQRLYQRAKEIIPGGTQLLSKRPEMFAPDSWPPYYEEAKGCEVTDMDGVRYQDFSTMGIGSCLLGYAFDPVDDAVVATIRKGSMSTLNPPREVELAETLLEIHGWAEAARFTRTGGEAMTVAVRVARTATGRNKVAVCGYHGWHDWYLAVNLSDSAGLDGQLLPGLAPDGVPRQLSDSAFAFRYNQIEELEALLSQHGKEIAAIVMEPFRYAEPKDGFLEKVLALAKAHGIVLIFDEITSGWRYTLGGIHLKFGVTPHLAVFAKAMSNGYPMGAVIGTRAIMQAAETSFISSTYWTEAMGPTAALASLAAMRDPHFLSTIKDASSRVATGLRDAARKHKLPLQFLETDAMVILQFEPGEEGPAAKTWYTKRMLEKGYLAGGQFYASAAHTRSKVDGFLLAAEESLGELARIIQAGSLHQELSTPVAHQGFQRLT